MKSAKHILLLTAVLFLCSALTPETTPANEITVNNASTATCNQPECYTTIAAALSAASGSSAITSILVEPGPYGNSSETLTLNSIILRGRETARTMVSSSITVTAGASTIKNITFTNATVGINVTGSANLSITNNIFRGNTTAVQVAAGSTGVNIVNNVFYKNVTALTTAADIPITSNIFMSNTTALYSTTLTLLTQVKSNDFFDNPDDGTWSPAGNANNNILDNPPFVDPSTTFDFHLSRAFPGSSGDMGAYGGSNPDTIPFQVAGVTTVQNADPSQVSVNWNKNLDYKVTSYRVWYGKTSGGPYDGTVSSGTGSNSPITVPTGTAASTYILSGLTTTVSPPASPVLNQPSPLNESLVLSWSAVDNATKYKIYYSESSFGLSSLPSTFVDVGNMTSYILPNLTNGKTYYVAVSAISEALYYVAVTAIYATNGTPGISNESIYSTEAPVGTGESKESLISEVKWDYPEAVVPYPDLPNGHKGCFIATAAYGYYSAPEVQTLRAFRDQYLLTSRTGRAFVRWYYEYGPVAAAYLDAHPGFKPMVRATLMPAVGMALFMTKTSLFEKILAVLCILSIALMIVYRFSGKRFSGSGGAH